jgi:1-acyl-sn-glycerol-3-phosphate acyltransferase
MARSFLIIGWTIVITFFLGIAALAVSLTDRTGNSSHKIAGIWARLILLAAGVGVTVRGRRHIDPERPSIYMSNHQSLFDIPVLLGHLPIQFRWLAKAELFRIPIFGQAMHRVGYISIDRSDRKSAFESLARAADMIRNGVSVLIFPEGTRSRGHTVRPFKKGGFVLAVDSGVPLTPIITLGTHEIMPKGTLKITPGDVTVEVRPPMDAGRYSRKTKDRLLDRVRQEIIAASQGRLKG